MSYCYQDTEDYDDRLAAESDDVWLLFCFFFCFFSCVCVCVLGMAGRVRVRVEDQLVGEFVGLMMMLRISLTSGCGAVGYGQHVE